MDSTYATFDTTLLCQDLALVDIEANSPRDCADVVIETPSMWLKTCANICSSTKLFKLWFIDQVM